MMGSMDLSMCQVPRAAGYFRWKIGCFELAIGSKDQLRLAATESVDEKAA